MRVRVVKSAEESVHAVVQLVAIALVAIGLGACTVQKDAEETNQTTKDLKATSDEMAKDTKKLSETSAEIESQTALVAKRISDLEYKHGTSHAAIELIKNIKCLLYECPLSGATDLLAQSTSVMAGMPFQFWNGDYGDDLMDLDVRFQLSSNLLFGNISSQIRGSTVDVSTEQMQERSFRSMSALSASLDFLFPTFEQNLIAAKVIRSSFYDLIVKALRNRGKMVRDEMFPLGSSAVLNFRSDAFYLLQLRHNYLPVMAAIKISGLKNPSEEELNTLVQALRLGKKLSLDKLDPEEMKRIAGMLAAAKQARLDLYNDSQIGMHVPLQFNCKWTQLLSLVDFGQDELIKNVPQSNDQIKVLKYTIASLYQEILAQNKKGVLAQAGEDPIKAQSCGY